MYNAELTIVDALESLRLQSKFEFIKEIIVINDGSIDKSHDVVTEYARQYEEMPITLIDTVNRGVSSARNTGEMHSKTDWIAFLDADDVWFPNKLERQCEVIAKSGCGIDVLGTAWDNKCLRIGTKVVKELHRGTVREICIKNFPQPSTVLMKKSVFDDIGGFDKKQHYAEDGNFFLKAAAKFGLYYLPEQLIEYGHGKRGFGDSGLSGNLKAMQLGMVKNLKEMRSLGYISKQFYYLMRVFYVLKYWRRIILTYILGVKPIGKRCEYYNSSV